MERRLAAILAADVVGYSRLIGTDEEGTLAALKTLRIEFIEPLIAEHRGRVVKLLGDGFLVEFHSAVDAAKCALVWQTDICEREHADAISFRIGINLGDIVIDGDDIFGDGVNVAARLEGLAPPGGMCVSDAVHEEIRNRVNILFEDKGKQKVKNIERPLQIWCWDPTATKCSPENQAVRNRGNAPTLVVSTFKNLSEDPEQAYFAEGICEDVVTGLSKNSALRVTSRNIDTNGNAVEAGGFDAAQGPSEHFVLEGSVRKSGGRTRVTARLINTRSGARVWAERFDREMDDLFELQDDIVASIVHALGAADGVIEKSARRKSAATRSQTGSAYDWYLQGRHHFYQHGDAGYDKAEDCYLRAMELDEGFGPACSALAWLYFTQFKLFGTRAFEDIRSQALELALKALQLDPQDFRAHWVLGGVYLHDGNHAQSMAEFDKALQINPNDANLLAWSAEAQIYGGKLDDALERCDRAIRINPNCPDWYHWIKAFALFHLGKYDEALSALNRMSTAAHAGKLKAAVHAHLGDLEEARTEATAFLQLVPSFRITSWALTESYADPTELDRYVEGLRMAGLPE